MDDKEVRIDSGLGTSIHNDCTKRLQNGNMPYTNREKNYSDTSSHPLAKNDTRPCAIIGPDRVLPTTDSSDVYMKTIPVDPWEYSESYRYPYDSIKMADYHQTRNISPRQTFQENMQRIMVPPTYSSIKNSDEPSLKNAKINVPAEGKYCDVPYSINTLGSEHKSVRSDSAMAAINPSFSRGIPPHGWHAGSGMQPLKAYSGQEYYQNSEYSNCTGPRPMPIVQPQRIVHDELLPVYPDRLYQESNIRFKPYPTGKEKFPQSRYEYVGANTFQPPSQIPLHKFDIQKPMQSHHYSMYPQGPYKYIDRRYPEPMMESYPRAAHPPPNTFRNHPIQPSYGPLPTNFYQNKPYPCPSDNSKSMHLNKLSYDANNKIYLELENSRSKGYPSPDNLFYNDRAKLMRADILVPGHTPMNTMAQQHLYRKDNSPIKGYDHISHYRHRDHHINLTNPLSRVPMQFSPNTIAISPCDSNTSNDTLMLGIPQEDCGYASQSSTTSIKSMDSTNGPIDYYKRQGYNYTSAIQNNSQRGNLNSRPTNSTDKKSLNVRQFLQMWNEGDEEDSENNKEAQNNSNYISTKSQTNNNQEQLYVLGLVNVPNEELSKYEHLQKVSKLPENIKGYNNIEILNQFEQLVESPNINNFHVKKPSLKEFKVVSKGITNNQSKEDLLRPVSPLDVEAKISQSVIHKEVGCNFEIKPCSPKVLNVDIATPVHDILGERLIEKVANPVLLNIGRGNENKIDKSVDESMDVTSCKMVSATYSPNNSAVVKPMYPLQDLDTNMGVCLASLPQLDNEIELNLPEVNQQFIDANKLETSCSPHPNLPVLEKNHQDSNFIKNKTNFQLNEETIKLSKFRKTKKVESASNNYNVISSNVSLTQRTDSVIIKNPENVKIQNESFNSFEIESSAVNNMIHNNTNESEISSNLLSSDNIVETAIDFSLNRNENISHNENTDNECNISTSILIEESDFYKSNMDSIETSNPTKDSENMYSIGNQKSDNLSPTFVPDNKQSSSKQNENSKLNGEFEHLTNKELQSETPFCDINSQISTLTNHKNAKQNKELEEITKNHSLDENNYNSNIKIQQSAKGLQTDKCNKENNLPELISKSPVTENLDNMYSPFNNNSNDKIDKTKLNASVVCPDTEMETKDDFFFYDTSNISNGDNGTTDQMQMSSNDSGSYCNDLSKSMLETTCGERKNKTLVTSDTTIKESNAKIVNKSLIISKQESENNNLKFNNIIQMACSESSNEILSSDLTTNHISTKANNETFVCDSLIIGKDEIKNDDLISENTVETPFSNSKNMIILPDMSTDVVNIEENKINNEECDRKSLIKCKDNIQNNESICINTIETTKYKNNDQTLFSSMTSDIVSVQHADNELNSKSLIKCRNHVQESDLIFDHSMQKTSYKDNQEILSLEVSTFIGTSPEKPEKFNQKSLKIIKDDIENNDLVSDITAQIICHKDNEILADSPTDIESIKENGEEFNHQSMIISKTCKEISNEKFDSTFETCNENKDERLPLDNHNNLKYIEEKDDVLKCKFDDNAIHNYLHEEHFTTSKIVHYKKRIFRKALLSPWIQKLIIHNIHNQNYNLHENESIETLNLEQSKKTESFIEEHDFKGEEKLDDIFGPKFKEIEDRNHKCSMNEGNNALHENEEPLNPYNTLTNIARPSKYTENLCDTYSRCSVSLDSEQNKSSRCPSPSTLFKHNSKLLRRTSKRSLSDTAIERYLENNDEQSYKRFKKYEEGFVQSQMIATDLCNIIQTNRRNSISEIYSEGDVLILIDKDLILTEENEEQKICFADEVPVTDNEYNHETVDTIAENLPQDDKDLWVDDVARIETIFSDEVAEDVEISTPSSPKNSIASDYEMVNNESFMLCEEVIRNMENDVDVYELNIRKDNTYPIDNASDYPKTKINEIFTCLESQNKEEIFTEDKSESNREKAENILNQLEISDTLYPHGITVNNDRIIDNKENVEIDNNLIQETETDSFHKSKIDSQHNNVNEKFDEYNCALNPCNYPKYSSSPEVTSTTCEDKNPAILLKISNHKGTRVSQIDKDKSATKNKISYKLTEKKTYKHYNPNFNSSGTLITKAAQKYIPPIKITMSDLKVKLPLPKNSLDKLKQLKKSKVEPKIDKNPPKSGSISKPREIKKQKPKFEDVLMSIDEFQYIKPKVKSKRVRNEIPKVVIKKNETGSHYTSRRCSNDRHNPDLTGRKWQPWVFLEKNSFIDKMALKHKVKAIYCRRKNTYVLAEKFRKYKSVYNAKFVISQPKTDDLKKGNLKYTIRLKHN